MLALSLHADRRLPALVQADDLPWLPSPTPGVDRRLLEREGGEQALATSLVRYAPGSRFPAHTHGLGEEYFVLQGCFSDEHGDHPAGSYVRNPPGSRHSPFSREGCVIFVKLRQMDPQDQNAVYLPPEAQRWQLGAAPGLRIAPLWSGGGASVRLESLQPGATRPSQHTPGGEEWLLVQGSLLVGGSSTLLHEGAWRRNAAPEQPVCSSTHGALLWVKRGHLPHSASPAQNGA